MIKISKMVDKKMGAIPFWAAIGNHDTYPQDSFKGHLRGENLAVSKWSQSWEQFGFLKDPVQRKHF